jgi:hypothetical protein
MGMKINNVVSLLNKDKEYLHKSIQIFEQSQLTTDLQNVPAVDLWKLESNLIIVKADVEKILAAMPKPHEVK